MKKPPVPVGVLSNEALQALVDETLQPDSLCWGEEDGQIVGGLWELAEEIGVAIRAAVPAGLHNQQSQIVFALRAFYLLGALRGGEAYRNDLFNREGEPFFEKLPFELDPLAAADFAEDLEQTATEYLDKFLELVGVSVPGAEEYMKGVPQHEQ